MNNNATHPQAHYRERLLDAVAAFQPRSVLEVGCGSGAFLRAATARGVTVQGIEPDAQAVQKLQAEGFSVRQGLGEALPHADGSYDLVVFSYTAHHVADWPAALAEALRVGRQGVVVLDPWYDARLPSQAVALAFDRWSKAIDRATGMVHNDCLDAAALLGPLGRDPGGCLLHIEYLLIFRELGPDRLRQAALAQLATAPDAQPWRPALDALLDQAQLDGYSDDGAILLVISKPG